MDTPRQVPLTPEQLAAIQAGGGVAHVEDPTTHRLYLLVEQGQAPALPDDYFRAKIVAGLAEANRGESRPWDVEALKANLRGRHTEETSQS